MLRRNVRNVPIENLVTGKENDKGLAKSNHNKDNTLTGKAQAITQAGASGNLTDSTDKSLIPKSKMELYSHFDEGLK